MYEGFTSCTSGPGIQAASNGSGGLACNCPTGTPATYWVEWESCCDGTKFQTGFANYSSFVASPIYSGTHTAFSDSLGYCLFAYNGVYFNPHFTDVELSDLTFSSSLNCNSSSGCPGTNQTYVEANLPGTLSVTLDFGSGCNPDSSNLWDDPCTQSINGVALACNFSTSATYWNHSIGNTSTTIGWVYTYTRTVESGTNACACYNGNVENITVSLTILGQPNCPPTSWQIVVSTPCCGLYLVAPGDGTFTPPATGWIVNTDPSASHCECPNATATVS